MPKEITAEEFFNQYGTREEMLKRSIEFAKLHVEAALKEASEKATIKYDHFDDMAAYINESSILNSYPLNLIK